MVSPPSVCQAFELVYVLLRVQICSAAADIKDDKCSLDSLAPPEASSMPCCALSAVSATRSAAWSTPSFTSSEAPLMLRLVSAAACCDCLLRESHSPVSREQWRRGLLQKSDSETAGRIAVHMGLFACSSGPAEKGTLLPVLSNSSRLLLLPLQNSPTAKCHSMPAPCATLLVIR